MKYLGWSKQTIYNVVNFLKEGHSAYDYYKANKNTVVGLKQVLHHQKKTLFKLIWNKIGVWM